MRFTPFVVWQVCLAFALIYPVTSSAEPSTDSGEAAIGLPAELASQLVDPFEVEKSIPFTDGEQLRFKIGWSLFTVARAELDVEPAGYEDRDAYRITLQARTNGFADAFYKVRNVSRSWTASDMSQAFEYNAVQDEGGRHRNTTARFDSTVQTAQYINHENGEVRDPISIMPGTFDPLSIVFFVRSIDFDVGDRLVVPTSNGKEFFYTIIDVKKKVKRDFLIGKREAFVLEPDIKDLGGVFKRSPDGRIRFFISADADKLPLRMESEVAVGKFWAELTEIGKPST